MRARIAIALLLLVAAAAVPAAAKMVTSQMMVVSSSAEISAPPATVWERMTSGKNLVTWCPMWKSPSNAAAALTAVLGVLAES